MVTDFFHVTEAYTVADSSNDVIPNYIPTIDDSAPLDSSGNNDVHLAWIAKEALISKYPTNWQQCTEMNNSKKTFWLNLNDGIYGTYISPRKLFFQDLYRFYHHKLIEDKDFDCLAHYEKLKKLMDGKCCISGCENNSELVTYAQHEAPLYCARHFQDGTATHSGEYLPSTTNAYSTIWSCCGGNWKMSKCPKNGALFDCFSNFIPITAWHKETVMEKSRLQDIEIAEREAESRRMGYDECYDR